MKLKDLNRICLVAIASLLYSTAAVAQQGATNGEWRSYGGDTGSTKYSPLKQIDRNNVGDLEVAWRWNSPDNALADEHENLKQFRFEATPLMVNGVLYISTGFNQIAAIDAHTGETIWMHDPGSWRAGRPTNLGFVHRGVSYWTDGDAERILMGTGDAHLIALDAKTGKPVPGFGNGGKVDLTKGLRRPIPRRSYSVSSPPLVIGDTVIVGSSISDGVTQQQGVPGDVRGFDVRTGETRWIFESIPQAEDFGNDTWENGSWQYTGNTNVWSLMSADLELGYIYLPFGTPTDDWYGGHRLGDNLFAESLVCIDAKTGERVWHFQMVHHGLWDYDLPAAPNLIDIVVDGRPIKAVAQVSKQGFVYVFDRVTGEPVWPIEELPVPRSTVPGERSSPTQPFPTKPAPFERQGVSEDDLIDFTPELREQARAILDQYNYGPLFTPPTVEATLNMPGWAGGANWSGAAADPETGMLYVTSITAPVAITLYQPDPNRSNLRYAGRAQTHVPGPQGLPLVKPPYSRLTAIDLNTGEHRWMVPLGDGPRNHPALKDLNLGPLGSGARGYLLLTKTLLFIGQESFLYPGETDPFKGLGDGKNKFRAFDKATGALIWETEVASVISAAPITYMSEGKQFVVVAMGATPNEPGEVVAFAIP
ncbi:MAG: pyrroloquinoline quinone-dependent dehydrogenase [Candidatus Hydrogenedentes bacterium]|nr:pyrroloquinoline quinone-dependent dehydrogenase [Candidatus Hydrogenedentota bacterium]